WASNTLFSNTLFSSDSVAWIRHRLEQVVLDLLLMCIFVFLYQGGRKLLSLEVQRSVPLARFLTLGLLVVVVVL
ncbi:hypothetical protein, partial [Paenibacillus zanthoxyli]|uniref:hypothetical protein n=1 Tax=Paenibacillus zanthoxyli TaxID=369399 RepID=UPI001E600C5C